MSHDLLLQMAYWRSLASWQLSYALAFFARVCITALGLSQAISSAPWVSSLLLQFMHACLHVLVVLQCVVVRDYHQC